MAFKTWSTGDVLTAADVNDYLMEQAVITCTSGTRPSSPNAGMTIFETDTKMFRHHTGAAWRAVVGAFPHVLLYKTSASIANNSTTTINWSSAGKNDYAMWSGGSASLITVPITGIYRVEASVRWASQAVAAGFRQVRIDVGGVEQNVFNLAPTTALNATNVVTHLTHSMAMTAAEQIEVKVYQNSGAALDIISPTRVLVTMVSEG